jgi:cytochrome c peroxidase
VKTHSNETRGKCPLSVVSAMLMVFGLGLPPANAQADDPASAAWRQSRLEDLGRALFFDVNLSLDRTQSCATCHDPAVAFIDWRDNAVGRAASLGDDAVSLGDRNAPSLSYARYSPAFHLDQQGQYKGGQFWDGRASNLAEQAMAPPLNPLEMRLADSDALASRLAENPQYQTAFKTLFGDNIFDAPQRLHVAMGESIAAFEATDFFSPFDSKYDRYLRGEYQPNAAEELGMTLFFSQQFTNCNQCHQLRTIPGAQEETFTNYSFENIGVPRNQLLRASNGLGDSHRDHGLLENPEVDDPAQAGRFKVPSLRNVAITAPYMHNGVFKDLKTVVHFYNKYNARSSASQINPETGEAWGDPEVSENLALDKLRAGPALDARRVDALVAFMRMLTDRRYEGLLPPE